MHPPRLTTLDGKRTTRRLTFGAGCNNLTDVLPTLQIRDAASGRLAQSPTVYGRLVKLPGQIAVVTGGAVRLGRAFALALAEAGCDVCVHYNRSAGSAAETVEELRSRGRNAVAVQADFNHPEHAAEELLAESVRQLGPPTILVNSAAIFEPGTLPSTTADHWRRHLAVNLEAPLFLCREFAKRRDATRPGGIVNVVDWRAQHPQAGHLAYTLTKAALVTLTQVLAQELAPDVQVNAIAPGAILPAPGATVAEFERQAETIPLQRTGNPADVAGAMLFLLQSEFITGEILHVTGGTELKVQ